MYYQTEMAPAYSTAVSPYPTAMSAMNIADMPAAGPAEKALWARVSSTTNNGRDKVGWPPEYWDRIDRAVHDEMSRVGIVHRFLPIRPAPEATTVSADTITETRESDTAPAVLSVDEAEVEKLIEIFGQFALTKQQIEAEEELQTAVTLAIRTANRLIGADSAKRCRGQASMTTAPHR